MNEYISALGPDQNAHDFDHQSRIGGFLGVPELQSKFLRCWVLVGYFPREEQERRERLREGGLSKVTLGCHQKGVGLATTHG